MTTLEIRAKEQAIERHITQLAQPAGRDTTEQARERATRAVSERIGAPLTSEQREALELITGPERWAVLIGQAGTGKGVVIDAAARAEQDIGRQVFGVAIAGATAERLGHDSPSLQGHTMTVDALLARAGHGRVTVDHNTTVFYDEAGMSDTSRLERFTRLIHDTRGESGHDRRPRTAPLDRRRRHVRTRSSTSPPPPNSKRSTAPTTTRERKAWAALRHGDPAYAMAHYQSRGQLHQRDTREQAAEAAVQRWAEHLDRHDPSELVILSDASNQEVDRLNARAQHLRGERGELGEHEIPHPEKPYSLREHDRVIFATQHHPPGQPRVENGSVGRITQIDSRRALTVALDATGREIQLAADELGPLRLAYAQHISRQQGATVQRAVALDRRLANQPRNSATCRPAAPATASTGSSPATTSATTAPTPTASTASPNACAKPDAKHHPSTTPNAPSNRRSSTARSTAASTAHPASPPAGTCSPGSPARPNATPANPTAHDDPPRDDHPPRPARRSNSTSTPHAPDNAPAPPPPNSSAGRTPEQERE